MPRKGAGYQVVLGAGLNVVVSASENRVALRILPSIGTGRIDLATQKMTAGSQGVNLASAAYLADLVIETHGTLVQSGWYAWAANAGDAVYVFETLAG